MDASATSFDNSALLNAIASRIKKIRRRDAALKEARKLLGENEQDELYRDLVGLGNKVIECDTAIVFYPRQLNDIPVTGPTDPKGVCGKFFREDLPELFPSADDLMAQMSVKDMTNIALDHGMVIVFGRDRVLNQIMVKNPYRCVKSFTTIKILFDKVSESLWWLDSYGNIPKEKVSAKDALGTHLLAYKRA